MAPGSLVKFIRAAKVNHSFNYPKFSPVNKICVIFSAFVSKAYLTAQL